MLDAVKHALKIEKLHKSYGPKAALDDLSLVIPKGKVTAILGPNGAGKSTLIKCLLGLSSPDGGSVEILGGQPGELAVRERTGVMFQEADLPDRLTPREHIALFASYYPEPLAVDDIIEQCQLAAFADKKYGALSGGQKRRVQFALAVAGQPDLIFLDEPTTGLDTEARRSLWQVIRGLIERDKTVLLTTHYLEEAEALADRIVILNQGRVLADGDADQIGQMQGASIIKFRTSAAREAIPPLAAAMEVTVKGRHTLVKTSDATQTLRSLLALDIDVSEITVSNVSLEDTLSKLIENSEENHHGAD